MPVASLRWFQAVKVWRAVAVRVGTTSHLWNGVLVRRQTVALPNIFCSCFFCHSVFSLILAILGRSVRQTPASLDGPSGDCIPPMPSNAPYASSITVNRCHCYSFCISVLPWRYLNSGTLYTYRRRDELEVLWRYTWYLEPLFRRRACHSYRARRTYLFSPCGRGHFWLRWATAC